MNNKPWVYEHMVQGARDGRPHAEPIRFATQDEAVKRRERCSRGGCSSDCRRAGSGTGLIRRN